jgi:catalase
MPELPSRLASILGVKSLPIGRLALIAVLAASAAAAFAYAGGWLSPQRLTPERIVDALSDRGGNPIGHRRNHAKGVCFTGYFEANGAGARLSAAPMFAPGQYPVIGRFAIGVGDPMTPDAAGRVRSMAVRIVAPDGQEWRAGMNNIPVFPVATPEAFYDLTVASDVVSATGKPDPQAIKRFASTHPEFTAFATWAGSAPWTASYADQAYNSLNAFRFVDAHGVAREVRWSMQPEQPPLEVPPSELAKRGPDFLEQDLAQRLAQGELRWHLEVTLAAAGDPTNDATKAWPAEREHVDVGALVVQQAQHEADGPCRDFNYDPLILPVGIEPSDDPLLPARSSTYANSFDRRTAEARDYARGSATSGGDAR